MGGESYETRLKLAPPTETVGSAGEAVDMGQLAAEVMQWTPQQVRTNAAPSLVDGEDVCKCMWGP